MRLETSDKGRHAWLALALLPCACGTPPPSVTVITEARGSQRLVQTASDIYAVDPRGAILRIPKNGEAIVQVTVGGGPIDDFIIAGSEVYFTQSLSDQGLTDLKRMPVEGGKSERLWPNVQRGSVRYDGEYLYFYDRGTDLPALSRLVKSGGTPERLLEFPNDPPRADLAVGANHVFFLTGAGELQRLPRGGGAPEPFLPGTQASQILIEHETLYYIGKSSNAATALFMISTTGGTPQLLLVRDLVRFTLTQSHIIYTTLSSGSSGSGYQGLGRAQRDGAKPQTLIGDLGTLTLLQPIADEDAVYWGDGEVIKKFPLR